MRRHLSLALAVAVLAIGGVTLLLYSQLRTAQSSNARLESGSRDTQAQYARAIDAIAEIQDSLNTIAVGESQMALEPRSLQAERNIGPPSGQEILERVQVLRASIERSRQRIAKLETDLHHSGLRVSGLQKLVASLRRTMSEKESQVAMLSAQVDTLHAQVGALTTQVAQVQDTVRVREAEVAERQRELATVYWIAASKRTLARSGVIEARGGLLGLGKTLTPSARVSNGVFNALDTDEQTVLPLPSARARVLSAQPASSYELRQVNGRMELHILEPREFRKVRQLVIMTA